MYRADENAEKAIVLEGLTKLRRDLHRLAELADGELQTAEKIRQYLCSHAPDELIEGVGGHGLAAVYNGRKPGRTVLVRAELDALPIDESLTLEYSSQRAGVSHKCGHDGHMTIVAGLAPVLSEQRPTQGRVVLLFQPAEETGQGAARMMADPKFAAIEPDLVLALHNLPGYPAGAVILRQGVFASASRGMIVELRGRTSHASEPHEGDSPALAMAQLVQAFSAVPQYHTGMAEASQITVVHARLGERAFGTSPGEAVVMATLRASDDELIERLAERCSKLTAGIGEAYGLATRVSWTEEFPVTQNSASAASIINDAASGLGLSIQRPSSPFPWSEDFGHFTARYPGALFGLGAGENHPALHNPEYDFPDGLLPTGIALFTQILRAAVEG